VEDLPPPSEAGALTFSEVELQRKMDGNELSFKRQEWFNRASLSIRESLGVTFKGEERLPRLLRSDMDPNSESQQ
jgi:hypothetical protein